MPLTAAQTAFYENYIARSIELNDFAGIETAVQDAMAPNSRFCGGNTLLASESAFHRRWDETYSNQVGGKISHGTYQEYLKLTETRFHVRFFNDAVQCQQNGSGGPTIVIVNRGGDSASSISIGSAKKTKKPDASKIELPPGAKSVQVLTLEEYIDQFSESTIYNLDGNEVTYDEWIDHIRNTTQSDYMLQFECTNNSTSMIPSNLDIPTDTCGG